ncbi:hypothetical protein K7432_003996 [Basidiobolus ranarum]|uniref:CCD97-like C-terminal domain-containing protein n=1 Tax=Basidiobolus ranarum TaxID=34480 RepID=A0ABR2WYY5_9FUNG
MSRKPSKPVQNRRYFYFENFLKDSSYFSLEEMKLREPSLYFELVDRFRTEKEKNAPFGPNMSLVDRMYHNIDELRFQQALDNFLDEAPEEEEEE